jgi:hypothetical protein
MYDNAQTTIEHIVKLELSFQRTVLDLKNKFILIKLHRLKHF